MSPVVLVPHDPSWAGRYEIERALLETAMGESLREIEHVGSTAILGIAAKAVIDIAASVTSFELLDLQALESAGYQYSDDYERLLPNRRYFRKGPFVARVAHLHVYELGDPDFDDYIFFRDWLRSTPDDARAYEELKRELATTLSGAVYAFAKTDFIRSVIARARASAAR